MSEKLDIRKGLETLRDKGLIRHNDASAVRTIEPGDINSAGAWLLWASFDIEKTVLPPKFETALGSRIGNVGDCFAFLQGINEAKAREQTWREAGMAIDSLAPGEVDAARIAIRNFLTEVASAEQGGVQI